MQTKPKKVPLFMRIDPRIDAELREKAISFRLSQSKLIEDAILYYLKNGMKEHYTEMAKNLDADSKDPATLSRRPTDSSRIHLFTLGKKIAVSVQAPNGTSGQSISVTGIRSNAVENQSRRTHNERDYGVGQVKTAGKPHRPIHAIA